MVNVKAVSDMMDELAVLKYFPGVEQARVALVRVTCEMADNDDQVRWLMSRMTSGIYAEWPGVREMRALFCSRFNPRDGINAYSSVYPDGIPADPKNPLQLEAPKMLALPPGHTVSADKSLETAVQILSQGMSIKNMEFAGKATAEEIAAAPEWLRKLEGFE